MKRLAIVLLIVVAAGALLMTACESPIWSRSDTEVSFDSSGHVTKDATYNYNGSYTETYSANGTYEDIGNSWDATSSTWKQASGDKGTYSYDTKTRIMTISYTQIWNGGIGGSYIALPTSSTTIKTDSFNAVFGATNDYAAYMGSGGTYIQSEIMTFTDGTSEKLARTIAVSSDLSTYSETSEDENYNISGTADGGGKSSYVYTESAIFPTSVTSIDKAKGQTITIDYLKYVYTNYTWTSGTTFTTGTTTTYNSSGSRTGSLASDGSYFAIPSITVARHLASK